MSSFIVNINLLGRIESIEIGYDEKVYDKVCAKFHLTKDSVDCLFSGSLLERETLLCDTNVTADDNLIEVVPSRKFQLYMKTSKIVNLRVGDDEYSSNELFKALINKEFQLDEYSVLIELMNILKDFCEDDMLNEYGSEEDEDESAGGEDESSGGDGGGDGGNYYDPMHELLQRFINKNNYQLVDIVARYVDINLEYDRYTPLSYSIYQESFEVFVQLLDMGADINGGSSPSPIAYASRLGYRKFVEELINKGAKDIDSAIREAAKESRVEIFSLLFDRFDDFDYQSLLFSVRTIDMVKKLSEKDVDIDAKNSDKKTLLDIVVEEHEDTFAAELISIGANVPDNLLQLATRSNCNGVVSLLLEKGATVDDQTMMIAANDGNCIIIDMFLEKDGNIRAKDASGRGVISYLVENDWKLAIKYIEKGADVNVKNKGESSPLHLSIIYNCESLFNSLIKNGADINYRRHDDDTPLIVAVRNNRDVMVKKLIKVGANVNISNDEGETALCYAIRRKYYDIASLLLYVGADPNIHGKESPLLINIKNRKEDMTEALLKNGAKVDAKCLFKMIDTGFDFSHVTEDCVNARNKNDSTLLMLAIWRHMIPLAEQLLKMGADINSVDKDGNSALLYTFGNFYDNQEIRDKLLEAGADVNVVNKKDESPISISIKTGRIQLYHKLISLGAKIDPDKYLFDALDLLYPDIAEDLLKRGANVRRSKNKKTPLMFALDNGDECMTKMILNFDPDVDFMNNEGRNALLCAMENEEIGEDIVLEIIDRSERSHIVTTEVTNWKVLEKLIFRRFTPIDRMIDGETLLMKAVKNGNVVLIEKLLEMGANVDIVNDYGASAMTYAFVNGDREIFEMLTRKL